MFKNKKKYVKDDTDCGVVKKYPKYYYKSNAYKINFNPLDIFETQNVWNPSFRHARPTTLHYKPTRARDYHNLNLLLLEEYNEYCRKTQNLKSLKKYNKV